MPVKEEVKKLTPSSFTYINQCPCWERKSIPPNDAMLRGTAMDGFLRNYLFHNMESLDGIAHKMLKRKDFDPLRNHPEFEKLCDRVKALIVTKPKEL